eukprot:jgi/Bigna1/72025/fgenesh1_pg.18_\
MFDDRCSMVDVRCSMFDVRCSMFDFLAAIHPDSIVCSTTYCMFFVFSQQRSVMLLKHPNQFPLDGAKGVSVFTTLQPENSTSGISDIRKFNFLELQESTNEIHYDAVLAENDQWLGEKSEHLYSHPPIEGLIKRKLTSCDASCKKWWIGDGTCDKKCLNADCAYDNGDCNLSKIPKIAYLHTGGTSLHKYLALLYASYGAQVCRIFSFECNPCSCGFWDPNAKRNGYGTGMHSCTVFSRPQVESETVCKGCVKDVLKTGCHYVELHHWDISIARRLKKKGYKIITMLRHPVGLLESSYNYEAFARHGQTGQIPGYMADQEGFKQWAADRHLVEGFDAIRMLAGCWYEHDDNVNATRDCMVNPTYNKKDELQAASAVKTKLSRKEMYVKAREALREMDYVGITENFQESIELLHRTFFNARGEGNKVCKKIREGDKKENVQKTGHKYSFKSMPKLLDDLAESMIYDISLYKEAQSIFVDSLQKYDVPVPKDLQSFTTVGIKSDVDTVGTPNEQGGNSLLVNSISSTNLAIASTSAQVLTPVFHIEDQQPETVDRNDNKPHSQIEITEADWKNQANFESSDMGSNDGSAGSTTIEGEQDTDVSREEDTLNKDSLVKPQGWAWQ